MCVCARVFVLLFLYCYIITTSTYLISPRSGVSGTPCVAFGYELKGILRCVVWFVYVVVCDCCLCVYARRFAHFSWVL